MRRRLLVMFRRIPIGAAVSIGLHLLLVPGMFLVPGVLSPRDAGPQASRVFVDPDASPDLVPPSDVSPPELAPSDAPPPEPLLAEKPPEEPPPFPAEAPPYAVAATDLTRLRPSVNRKIIGVGGGSAAAREPARPAPAPPPASPPPPPPPPPPTRAVPELSPPPAYPARAVEREIEGRVLLLVEVRPDGSVGEITVRESSGHAILDRAALTAVRKWRFEPARVQGQPVRSLIEVPINFRLTE